MNRRSSRTPVLVRVAEAATFQLQVVLLLLLLLLLHLGTRRETRAVRPGRVPPEYRRVQRRASRPSLRSWFDRLAPNATSMRAS